LQLSNSALAFPGLKATISPSDVPVVVGAAAFEKSCRHRRHDSASVIDPMQTFEPGDGCKHESYNQYAEIDPLGLLAVERHADLK